jgi:hypothetical protein
MRQHQLTHSAALALALAALAAPTAAAQSTDLRSPDARDAASAAQSTDLRSPDARDAAAAAQSTDVRSPDARDAAAAARSTDLRSPDARDAAEGRGTFNAPAVTVVKVPQPTPATGGMDWTDAGIGAGALLGLIALGVGGSIAVVRRRHASATRRQTATTG